MVALLQERVDDQVERLGRDETADLVAPEGDVAGRRAGRAPGLQRFGSGLRRGQHFSPHKSLDATDRSSRKLVPPAGETAEEGRQLLSRPSA